MHITDRYTDMFRLYTVIIYILTQRNVVYCIIEPPLFTCNFIWLHVTHVLCLQRHCLRPAGRAGHSMWGRAVRDSDSNRDQRHAASSCCSRCSTQPGLRVLHQCCIKAWEACHQIGQIGISYKDLWCSYPLSYSDYSAILWHTCKTSTLRATKVLRHFHWRILWTRPQEKQHWSSAS